MSFGVILATHAQIGCALLEGAEMLAGKQERARALALTENKPSSKPSSMRPMTSLPQYTTTWWCCATSTAARRST